MATCSVDCVPVDSKGTYRAIVTLDEHPFDTTLTGANLGIGEKIIDFSVDCEAANISNAIGLLITSAWMDISFDGVTNNSADTPVVGLGTVVASGEITDINGTATFENILTGQEWAAALNGTAQTAAQFGRTIIGENQLVPTTADVYLNMADAWTGAETAGDLTVSGTVVVEFKVLGNY